MVKRSIRLFRNDKAKRIVSLSLILLIYSFIIILSINRCYFWDNVQFTSKEAHWYYNNNFSSLLLPGFSENSEIVGSGCHPPLIGIMTAVLWKVFGKHLWVSHVFIGLWALVLVYNSWKLLKIIIPDGIAIFVLPVLLLDSTILSQIFIASPDIVLLASFVTAVRTVIERKRWLLTVALIFLLQINGRGAAAGGVLFLFYIIHEVVSRYKRLTVRLIIDCIIPFIPALVLASFYYVSYILKYGWIFNNPDSPWISGWQKPEGFLQILKNLASFILRLGENGRFIVYILVISTFLILKKRKLNRTIFKSLDLSLVWLFSLLFLFFFYFVVTTTSAMTSRYYMGMFFILNILLFRMLPEVMSAGKIKIVSIIIIVFLLTGNFWTYPDKISKAWDASLAHLPYYSLRSECLNYLEINGFDFNKVSGGFCFKGNQKYVDLEDRELYISDMTDNQYFIYSNIANLDDELINELTESGKWEKIKTFKKGSVFVTIYKNGSYFN